MKKAQNALCGLFAATALIGASTAAFAQTCASPIVLTAGATGSDNTCSTPTGTGANTIGTYCGAIPSSENEIIYSVTLGSGATGSFDLTNVGANFNAAIVLFQAADATACLTAASCVGLPADSNGNGGNESLSFSGDSAGQYYIAVTGSPGSNSCGAYNWAVTGTLPVKLQSFEVK